MPENEFKNITDQEKQLLEKYLQEIKKLDVLTPEQEVELAQRVKQGDEDALESLVKANLRFVVSVAKQYENQGLSLSDLINEGNLGLIKAANRFDETRGFKFISYAVWWIRQSIFQALAEQSRIVRLPLNKVGSLNKINKAFSMLEQEFEREPSAADLAEAEGIESDEVSNTLKLAAGHVSVDVPHIPGEENSLLDVLNNINSAVTGNDLAYNESLSREIDRSLSALTDRQQDVIKLYFGITEKSMSLEDIGNKFGLTRERVRTIKDKAIEKLRATSRSKHLKTSLGLTASKKRSSETITPYSINRCIIIEIDEENGVVIASSDSDDTVEDVVFDLEKIQQAAKKRFDRKIIENDEIVVVEFYNPSVGIESYHLQLAEAEAYIIFKLMKEKIDELSKQIVLMQSHPKTNHGTKSGLSLVTLEKIRNLLSKDIQQGKYENYELLLDNSIFVDSNKSPLATLEQSDGAQEIPLDSKTKNLIDRQRRLRELNRKLNTSAGMAELENEPAFKRQSRSTLDVDEFGNPFIDKKRLSDLDESEKTKTRKDHLHDLENDDS